MKSVFGFAETQRALRGIQGKIQSRTKQAFQDAALMIERAAKENIAHGRTDWPALKPATIKARKKRRKKPKGRHDQPLYDRGTLMRSIHSEAEEMMAAVGSGLKHSPVHEFGTKTAGRKRNVTIPARAYLEPAANENMHKVKEIFVRRLRGH